MKNILILLLLPFTLCAQQNVSPKKGPLSIGLISSPDYCYRTLKPDAATQGIYDVREEIELPKLGFSAGLSLLFQLNKRFFLETGVLYSDKGERIKKDDFIVIEPDPAVPQRAEFIYHYNYLGVPLKANYFLIAKRFSLFLSGGLSADYAINQKSTVISTYTDHTTRKKYTLDYGFSRFNLAFSAGIGMHYSITDKWAVRVEPEYRRSITSVSKGSLKGYLYSVGLSSGIYYTFK